MSRDRYLIEHVVASVEDSFGYGRTDMWIVIYPGEVLPDTDHDTLAEAKAVCHTHATV